MKNTMTRITAVTISACLICLDSTQLAAGATGISCVQDSELDYSFTAETVTIKNDAGEFDKVIKLTFAVDDNPGFNTLRASLRVDFDVFSQYTDVKYGFSQEFVDGTYCAKPVIVPEKNLLTVEFNSNYLDNPTMWPYDENKCFWYSIYLIADESEMYSSQFACTIIKYDSLTEGVSVDITSPDANYTPDISLNPNTEELSYTLGDVSRDGKIDIHDVAEINSIISLSTESGYSNSVESINNLLNSGEIVNVTASENEQYSWAERFPGLILDSGIACAEIANVVNESCDQGNFLINVSDSNAVLSYYSNLSANLDTSNIFNTPNTKTVVLYE